MGPKKIYPEGYTKHLIGKQIYAVNRIDKNKVREGYLVYDKSDGKWYYRNKNGDIVSLSFGSSSYSSVDTISANSTITITHNKEAFVDRAYYVDDSGFIQELMVKNNVDLNSVIVYSSVEVSSREIILKF